MARNKSAHYNLREERKKNVCERVGEARECMGVRDEKIPTCTEKTTHKRMGASTKTTHDKNKSSKTANLPVYECWTDGSCDNVSSHRAGGAAYIVVNADSGEIERVRTYRRLGTTNNRMEMLAVISAVNYCPEGSQITIHTDSKYTIKMFQYTNWQPSLTTKNVDLISLYRKVCKGKNVRFDWVKGHNGDDMNEQADALAFHAYERVLEENGLRPTLARCKAGRADIKLEETA